MDHREKNIKMSRSVAHDWCEMAGDYEQIDTLKFMELARLDRIAGALESIDRDLKKLVFSKIGKE